MGLSNLIWDPESTKVTDSEIPPTDGEGTEIHQKVDIRDSSFLLEVVHDAGIICIDKKADNILVNKHTKKVYFIDFNFVKFISNENSSPYYSYFSYDIFVKQEDANEEFTAYEKELEIIFRI